MVGENVKKVVETLGNKWNYVTLPSLACSFAYTCLETTYRSIGGVFPSLEWLTLIRNIKQRIRWSNFESKDLFVPVFQFFTRRNGLFCYHNKATILLIRAGRTILPIRAYLSCFKSLALFLQDKPYQVAVKVILAVGKKRTPPPSPDLCSL